MSRCFPFPPPGYTNKGYEKKAITEDVELLTKVNVLSLYSQGTFCFIIMIWDAKMKFLVNCVAVKYKIHLCKWTIKLFFKNIRAMWLSI